MIRMNPRVLLPLLCLGLISCSGPAPDYRQSGEIASSRAPTRVQSPASSARAPHVQEVRFVGEVITGQPVRTQVLTANGEVFDPDLAGNFDLLYQWSRDKAPLPELDLPELPSEYVQAGDWIRCQVRLVDSSGKVLKILHSPLVEVGAYSPLLELAPVTIPPVPGVLEYRISARDDPRNYPPGTDTEGNLVYELIDPPAGEIQLDSGSGRLTWPLTPELIEDLKSPRVIVRFRVSNPFGASVTGEILLQFRSETRTREPGEEETGT